MILHRIFSLILEVEYDGVHHGEGPVIGQEVLHLREGQAGDSQEPRRPHQKATLDGPLGKGGQEGWVIANYHHCGAP